VSDEACSGKADRWIARACDGLKVAQVAIAIHHRGGVEGPRSRRQHAAPARRSGELVRRRLAHLQLNSVR
jgi:hypothetical protein